MTMLRIVTAAVLAPLAFLALLTGLLLVAGCGRLQIAVNNLRCELPDAPRLSRQAILDDSPTLIGGDE